MSAAYEQVQVDSREQWRAWLTEHAASSPGIWLITWKKGFGPHLAYDDVVEEALCFGWVDSQPRTVDDQRTSRLLTPRRPGSSWSRVNKQRVQRLTEAGLMTPAGLAAVRAARAGGSWSALDQVEELAVPPDLRAALNAQPLARALGPLPPLHQPRDPGVDRRRQDRRHTRPSGRADRQRGRGRPTRQPVAPASGSLTTSSGPPVEAAGRAEPAGDRRRT